MPAKDPAYVTEWLHRRVVIPDGRRGLVSDIQQRNEDRVRVLRVRVALDDGPLWFGTTDELTRLASDG
jgi:hypothetical protein